MKIAIIGNGPVALESAVEFLHEGADVRVLGQGELGSKIKFLSDFVPELEIDRTQFLRPRTQEILNLNSSVRTFSQLWTHYYLPMIDFVGGRFSQREVLRIQKRFLQKDEVIEGRSRLLDLFRVTSALNPSGMVEQQINENPELKEKLGDDILNSLKNQVESFEDFDLVFDCRGPHQKALPAGTGEHYALNEKTISSMGDFYYGREAFLYFDEITKRSKTITLVGSSEESAIFLLKLENWLEEGAHVLNLISEKGKVFSDVYQGDRFSPKQKEKLKGFISQRMAAWREECQKIEVAIKEWRELPDHERVKVPQPQFPEPQLRPYEGYSVSSCDKLIDQKQAFLTLEMPPWRDPENEKKEILTLGQDSVVVLKGSLVDQEVIRDGLTEEPGYFQLFSPDMTSPVDSFKLLDRAREQVFKYFSRA